MHEQNEPINIPMIRGDHRLQEMFGSRLWMVWVIILSALGIGILSYHSSDELSVIDALIYGMFLIPLFAWLRDDERGNYFAIFGVAIIIWIADMMLYRNLLAHSILPTITMMMVIFLYLSASKPIDHLYEILIPRVQGRFTPYAWSETLIGWIRTENVLYRRVLMGVMVSLPMISIFIFLLRQSDPFFDALVTQWLSFLVLPSLEAVIEVGMITIVMIFFFLYMFLNQSERPSERVVSVFDPLIVGIFLGSIVGLFAVYLMVVGIHLYDATTLSQGAREGFFQLSVAMGIVVVILMVLIRRIVMGSWVSRLLVVMLLESVVMGMFSLAKMYRYEQMFGMTPIRYYVEWFEIFLMVVLGLGSLFVLRGWSFKRFLDATVLLGLIALTLVASLNVDVMVAHYNVTHIASDKLDREALSTLSIDAIAITSHIDGVHVERDYPEDGCEHLSTYHIGTCQKEYAYSTYLRLHGPKD